MNTDISNPWVAFFTTALAPPGAEAFEDEDHLAKQVTIRILEYLDAINKCGLCPESLVLAQFVHVLPDGSRISIEEIQALLRSDKLEQGRKEICRHQGYIKESKISFFRNAFAKQKDMDPEGWMFFLSRASDSSLENSDQSFRLEQVGMPYVGAATGSASFADATGKHHQSSSDKAMVDWTLLNEKHSHVCEDTQAIDVSQDNVDIPTSFITIFQEGGDKKRESALEYIRRISSTLGQLVPGPKGGILLCVPQVHTGHKGISIGGIGGIFVLDSKPDIALLKKLYVLTHYVSSRIFEIYNMAYVMLPKLGYQNTLFTFGHHIGRLFRESGIAGLNDGASLTGVKNRLMPVWGIANAARPIKNRGKGYPKDWFPDDYSAVHSTLRSEELSHNILRICKYYLAPQISTLLDAFGSFSLPCSINGKEIIISATDISSIQDLVTLSPFKENDTKPGTTALTIGLTELLRNACDSLALQADSLMEKLINTMPSQPCPMRLNIITHKHDHYVAVEIDNMYFGDRKEVYSDTIAGINRLEADALAINNEPVVQTQRPVRVKSISEVCHWMRGKWTYYYTRPQPYTENGQIK